MKICLFILWLMTEELSTVMLDTSNHQEVDWPQNVDVFLFSLSASISHEY